MGILRYWLTGEYDEIDKAWLVINLYNRRRKIDPSCKNAPRGERIPHGAVMALPECIVLEIVEAYTVLTSWSLTSEEALARIERYRARYHGAGAFRDAQDLGRYLGYRLSVEKTTWPRSAELSSSLVRHAVDRCGRFFAKFPPTANAIWSVNPFEPIDVPRASLLAPIDDLDSERRAVPQNERQSIDQLQMFYLEGDSNWRFLYNIRGGHWVYQGYALLRGASIPKAVVISETRYNFSAPTPGHRPSIGRGATETRRPLNSESPERTSPGVDLQWALGRIREIPNRRAVYDFCDDLCVVASVDRASIYQTSVDGSALLILLHRGLNSFPEVRLPITNQSIPGFVAGSKKSVTIRDVYDDLELAQHNPELGFLKAVDQKTGYRTRQMLAVPVLDGDSGELLGVVQLINPKSGLPFSAETEELVEQIARALAVKLQTWRRAG